MREGRKREGEGRLGVLTLRVLSRGGPGCPLSSLGVVPQVWGSPGDVCVEKTCYPYYSGVLMTLSVFRVLRTVSHRKYTTIIVVVVSTP